MASSQMDATSHERTSSERKTAAPAAKPHVKNANRIVVGFPFSTIKIEDAASAAAVADLVARLCRLLANSASADTLDGLAAEAEHLKVRLRQ